MNATIRLFPSIRSFPYLAAAILGASATSARAQSLAMLAQDCSTLADPPRLVLQTGPAVPAGSTLLVALATNSNSASDIRVSDPLASRYSSVGGSVDSASGLVLVLLHAPLERSLPAASEVTIAFGNVSSGTYACAQAYAAGGIGFNGQVLDALGARRGSSRPALGTTMPANAVSELAFAAFASDGTLGTADSPATMLGSVCAADVCLTGAYYVTNTGGTTGVAFDGGSQTRWAGVLGALYADDIFGNGFD